MTEIMPLPKARNKLLEVADRLEKKQSTIEVTKRKRGKPVLAIMSWEIYQSRIESLEIMYFLQGMYLLQEKK